MTSKSQQGARGQHSRDELIAALCHEVGNELAGIRLGSHLLEKEAPRGDLAEAARQLESLSAQAGTLLAQIRPLLFGNAGARTRIATPDLLASLARAVTDSEPPGLRVSLPTGRRLPDIRVDSEAVHHLLVSLVLGAIQAAGPSGRVRVGASLDGRRVCIAITDDGAPLEPGCLRGRPPQRGRALLVRVAAEVARASGGSLRLTPRRQGSRIEVRLPVASGASRGR